MLRRSGGSECAGEEINLSPTRISPALGSTKPAISRNVVVLPQPDGPSRQTRWPCSMVSEISSTTATVPYRLVRPRNSTDATQVLPISHHLPRLLLSNAYVSTPQALVPCGALVHDPVNAGLRFSMNAVR